MSVILGAQAISGFSSDRDPELALRLLPINGIARAAYAFETTAEKIGEDGSIPVPSPEAIAEAKMALADEPLAVKAQIVLALSQMDESGRLSLISLANELNRRDLALQGLVLKEAVADNDYGQSIATLDRILRVHPDYSTEFFPFLVQALANEETIATFATLLNGTSPWHSRFLEYASRQDAGLSNLAQLRPQLDFAAEGYDRTLLSEFDRRVIARLVASNELDSALELYKFATGAQEAGLIKGVLDWRSEYPPFDWYLINEPGFRSQQTPEGDALEVAIRPGKGGIFAERFLRPPQTPFSVRFDFDVSPADRARDVRLQLTCRGGGSPFFDQPFSENIKSFTINQTPPDCEYLGLALSGRAWSGRSKLDIEIRSITIEPQ